MMRVQSSHTCELDQAELAAVRLLMDEAFRGDFDDQNWDHALGGMHVLVFEGDELIGHGSVVQRRLLHGGRALRCGYVEAVAVRADRQRRGHGARIMEALGRMVRGGYELGALGATDEGRSLYAAHGWRPWSGRTFSLTPSGIVRTPETDASLMVLPGNLRLDLDGDLTCDWRDGDVW